MTYEISPKDAKKAVDGKKAILVDVRNQDEWDYIHIDGATFIPLHELSARLDEVNRLGKPIICYCHHGNRSLFATMLLQKAGIDAKSMAGGIEEWALQVDKKMKRY